VIFREDAVWSKPPCFGISAHKTIKQIAEETAFATVPSEPSFRREFGCGPAQFRSQMENYRER
jgi:AraC-like DNA-binding protein